MDEIKLKRSDSIDSLNFEFDLPKEEEKELEQEHLDPSKKRSSKSVLDFVEKLKSSSKKYSIRT